MNIHRAIARANGVPLFHPCPVEGCRVLTPDRLCGEHSGRVRTPADPADVTAELRTVQRMRSLLGPDMAAQLSARPVPFVAPPVHQVQTLRMARVAISAALAMLLWIAWQAHQFDAQRGGSVPAWSVGD